MVALGMKTLFVETLKNAMSLRSGISAKAGNRSAAI